ncbi:MAG: DMT family transporter [Anaerolineales bacterium]|nr:DMT family transporter [Anaerolineales bacterium]MCS7247173.1 DMT family transporter [Anaerolineales bacterium]MDW8160984.1 DMT family transporter [Anaerolineales bacterium]MDW8448238.1 DMT family transporter [Anaerolineales bacterium]
MLEKTVVRPAARSPVLNLTGILSAVFSATLLGFTPILGKLAILYGVAPFLVVTLRTVLAAFFMGLTLLATNRASFFIYPAGLLGCALAGILNGVGSLFYYQALALINANVGQLIFLTYPVFVTLWLILDRYTPSAVSFIRVGLIVFGIGFLIIGAHTPLNLRGVFFMLVAAAGYGLHLLVNQRVLLEMPAPTVTFYTLLFMSLVVLPFGVFSGQVFHTASSLSLVLLSFVPVLALAGVTFLSRLALFLGVKRIGGLQTALLGVTELLVTLTFAKLWLQETLNLFQWIGVALIVLSIVLLSQEKPLQRKPGKSTWLHWLQPHTFPNRQNPPLLD